MDQLCWLFEQNLRYITKNIVLPLSQEQEEEQEEQKEQEEQEQEPFTKIY